ncbi:MAG: response regulator [Anaerolineae bacterium]|jgi:CheY-like chemotaxis protein|nr:response regulator [Anaerolineae bacterium]
MSPQKELLLIEDNDDHIALIQYALQKSNLKIVLRCFNNGRDALHYLFCLEPPQHPLLVLLDLDLPGMHGLEVLQKIRENEPTKTLPVVILTVSHREEELLKSYQLGVNSFLRKPNSADQFSVLVQQLSQYWATWNELNEHYPY